MMKSWSPVYFLMIAYLRQSFIFFAIVTENDGALNVLVEKIIGCARALVISVLYDLMPPRRSRANRSGGSAPYGAG